MTWRRADEGDMPALGQEISMCEYRLSDTTVRRWRRLRVDVIFENPVRIFGAGLPCDTLENDWPEKPETITGRAVFWKEFEP